ncbi:hypothetical protein QN360_21635, partial [Glaciimonas sp. CA11.2]|uniref:hypothetical protein n=1 Tax=Glaciimonas sp. CA11.2 TaxID=3048601 RepID=UPI002B2290D5
LVIGLFFSNGNRETFNKISISISISISIGIFLKVPISQEEMPLANNENRNLGTNLLVDYEHR